MNLSVFKDLELFAKNILDCYGYSNWDVQWDAEMIYAGRTNYQNNIIFLSTQLSEINTVIQKDVIIHEIAHVRAGQFAEAHGNVWKQFAIHMGGTGNIKITC